MRVLVTGAAGFIGAHVTRELIERGHQAYAVVRPGDRAGRLLDVRARCEVVEADLADTAQVAGLLADSQPDAIIHLAWYAEPGRYRHALAENIESLRTSANLLVAASRSSCRRVVLGGTCLENADGPVRPIYDAAKGAVHRLSEGFADSGLRVACGHVFYLYGPLEDERRVIPSVIRALLAGTPIPTTTALQRRDYLAVADVAAAFVVLAESSLSGAVDICSGSQVTLADVLRLIAEQIGRPELLLLGERGPGEDEESVPPGDPGPLEALGWEPRYDLRRGIDETINWWRARQEAIA
jgi:nucleoside-diphosphate-sugar epimerase